MNGSPARATGRTARARVALWKITQLMIAMNHRFSRVSSVPRPAVQGGSGSLPVAFSEQLSSLYGLVQRSRYVFGSPLGPFNAVGREFHIPRFVYFGPHTSDVSVRLSFLAGFDHRDLRPTLSLLHFVERLALNPDIGQGLNLSVFPLVDVLGLWGAAGARNLGSDPWVGSENLELDLLERDARQRAYHGFVRVESAHYSDEVSVSIRGILHTENPSPDIEVIGSDDIEPFAVRWEVPGSDSVGPLSVAEDLGIEPFELTIRIPAAWSVDLYREATASILKRFVQRYRGFVAYGQHL